MRSSVSALALVVSASFALDGPAAAQSPVPAPDAAARATPGLWPRASSPDAMSDAATETRSLAEVVEWLGRHGVAAESRLVDQGVEFLDALGLLTLTETPDLIVAGGYGHSRFREWLFGGVTNDLLAARNISRLFSN